MAFPVTSISVTATIEVGLSASQHNLWILRKQGIKTELVISSYDDTILVLVTQIGKVGTMLKARKEEAYGGGPTYAVQTLMGKRDEPFLVACTRQLVEKMSEGGVSRTLILSLGLRDHSPKTLKSIVELVVANKAW